MARRRLLTGRQCAGKDRVELLLSIGASRWEASRDAISHSVRVACMPIINQMNVVGFVSIPGMMTGQILSGSDPSQVPTFSVLQTRECPVIQCTHSVPHLIRLVPLHNKL